MLAEETLMNKIVCTQVSYMCKSLVLFVDKLIKLENYCGKFTFLPGINIKEN